MHLTDIYRTSNEGKFYAKMCRLPTWLMHTTIMKFIADTKEIRPISTAVQRPAYI